LIRKYLVRSNKQVYLSASKSDVRMTEETEVVELLLPVESLWEVEKLMDSTLYMLSTRESQSDLVRTYKEIFRLCSKYTVHERDRVSLLSRANEQ
jgi:hypothetical protein